MLALWAALRSNFEGPPNTSRRLASSARTANRALCLERVYKEHETSQGNGIRNERARFGEQLRLKDPRRKEIRPQNKAIADFEKLTSAFVRTNGLLACGQHLLVERGYRTQRARHTDELYLAARLEPTRRRLPALSH